jgi:hypothetical protein
VNGMCRVISSGKGQNLFLIGTTKNCVFQANFDLNYLNCIVNGHDNELWGLASNPRESHFLTCGNTLLLYWDSLSHSQIWSCQFEESLHCVNIHYMLDLAAISIANKPKWVVFDLRFKLIKIFIDSKLRPLRAENSRLKISSFCKLNHKFKTVQI